MMTVDSKVGNRRRRTTKAIHDESVMNVIDYGSGREATLIIRRRIIAA